MIGYSLVGSGPQRVIVLHGWFGDSTVFEPMLSAIDRERFTFALMDYRGYGKSVGIDGPFDIETIAQDATSLADHLGWERFSLVGHSMGGKAALKVAVDTRDRVEGLIAITPVWAGPAPFDADTLSLFRGAASSLHAREMIIRHSTRNALTATWYQRQVEHSFNTSSPEAFSGYFESWSTYDFADEVAGLAARVLIIAGECDAGVPVEMLSATWLSALPDARLSIVQDAGHYPMQEAPLRVAAVVEDFLHN